MIMQARKAAGLRRTRLIILLPMPADSAIMTCKITQEHSCEEAETTEGANVCVIEWVRVIVAVTCKSAKAKLPLAQKNISRKPLTAVEVQCVVQGGICAGTRALSDR